MAGRYDFTIEQGATFSRVITWKDEGGDPINLTGYTASLQARGRRTDTTTLIDLSVGNGITLGGSAGTITIAISAADTADYDFTNAVYNLELTSGGVTTRVLQGVISLSKEVAR